MACSAHQCVNLVLLFLYFFVRQLCYCKTIWSSSQTSCIKILFTCHDNNFKLILHFKLKGTLVLNLWYSCRYIYIVIYRHKKINCLVLVTWPHQHFFYVFKKKIKLQKLWSLKRTSGYGNWHQLKKDKIKLFFQSVMAVHLIGRNKQHRDHLESNGKPELDTHTHTKKKIIK